MHSSGSITRIRPASWMQSTGQTSTQDLSLMSMQGSAMMYVIAAYRTGAVSSSISSAARSESADLATPDRTPPRARAQARVSVWFVKPRIGTST